MENYVRKTKGSRGGTKIQKYKNLIKERTENMRTEDDETFKVIGEKLGCSKWAASKLFNTAMAKILKGLESVPGTPSEKADALIEHIRTEQLPKTIITEKSMIKSKLTAKFRKQHPNLLLADGFDKAFVGIISKRGTEIAVYDEEKCIEVLKKDMTEAEAEEYFEYNVLAAYVSEFQPVYISKNSDSYECC